MDNTYSITRKKAVELINDIDKFIQGFDKFKIKFPNYNCTIDIIKSDIGWVANVNIKRDEEDTNQPT